MKTDFPLFANNPGLVYLDYANTAPKPYPVIEAISQYYSEYSGNVHRANHSVGSRADAAYEAARHTIADYFSVQSNEVVFQKNTTEAINLVAQSYVGKHLQPGDTILCTGLEHHANLVSWQLLAARYRFKLVFSRVTPEGLFDETDWLTKLSEAKFAAFTAVSNVTGERLPYERMIREANARRIRTLVDGAQLAPHEKIQEAPDFFVFSGHKMYGPTGIGVLIGRYELLDSMEPWIGGGDMIETVRYDESTFQPPPLRFEAGTPPIASVIGLGAALTYMNQLDSAAETSHESQMMAGILEVLEHIEGIRFLGQPRPDHRLVSFVIDGVHSMDLGAFLDEKSVAVRVGKMCAHPLLEACGVDSAIRASSGLPTDQADVDAFRDAITKGVKLLR